MGSRIDNIGDVRQLELPLVIPDSPPIWRPIHYLGSKLRLLDPIRECLAELEPNLGTVCDLFAGSGTVSLALSAERDVTAADIQEYSRVLCSALLLPNPLTDSALATLFTATEQHWMSLVDYLEPILEYEQRAIESATTNPTLLCDLVEHGSLLGVRQGNDALTVALRETQSRIAEHPTALMASRYFGGIYFAYHQTLYIDAALAAIDELHSDSKETYLAALLSTASTIVNSIGKQFAQPMRPRRNDGTIKQHLIAQMCRDRCQDAKRTYQQWLSRYRQLARRGTHRVIRGDFRDVLRNLNNVAVIYADPPYTRDHYSRFYHVLETLCLRDFPAVSTTLLTGSGATSRGLYRVDRHQSPFCIKSQAPAAFTELFAGSKSLGVPLLLSYSPFIKEGHPRLMTIEAVEELARVYFTSVHVVPAARFAHSKLNKSSLHLDTSRDAEVFLLCRP